MGIWDRRDNIKAELLKKQEEEKANQIPLEVELKEEIMDLRRRNKEFAATNECDTYLVVCFSTKEDKDIFLHNLRLRKTEHTYIDGYEVAKNFDIEPKIPKFSLKKPLNK